MTPDHAAPPPDFDYGAGQVRFPSAVHAATRASRRSRATAKLRIFRPDRFVAISR